MKSKDKKRKCNIKTSELVGDAIKKASKEIETSLDQLKDEIKKKKTRLAG